jgi:hypothetical protein
MSRRALSCALLVLGGALTAWASPSSSAPEKQAYDKPPPGYHDLTVGSGAGKTVIRVRDSMKPTMEGGSSSASDGNYDPEHMNFNKSSPMADKSFSTSNVALSKNNKAAESQAQLKFNTSSFATTSYNQSGQKFQTAAYHQSARGSDGFSKAFTLPGNDAVDTSANKSFAGKTSEYQGKTSQIAQAQGQTPSKADPFATPSSLNEKAFYDPMMNHVKRDPYAAPLDVKRLADLPNRALTITEVGNLINHEQIPDLNAKADEENKALNLNDPKWRPPTAAPMIPDSPPVAPPAELEKPGELPAPGEMAQPPPENSEPLPK